MKNKISGIYKITNTITNDFYIGSSIDVNKRFLQHLNKLLNKTHRNCYLQRSYNKYGKETFIFELLYKCPKEYLIILENKCIEVFNPKYNLKRSENNRVVHSEETKIKIGLAGKNRNVSEETRKRISEGKKGHTKSSETLYKIFKNSKLKKTVIQYDLHGNFIQSFESTREAARKLNLRYSGIGYCCRELIKSYKGFIFKYTSENPNTKYRKHSDETKEKMRNKGKKVNQLDDNGNILNTFDNIKKAALHVNTVPTNIGNALSGRVNRAMGYYWKYA